MISGYVLMAFILAFGIFVIYMITKMNKLETVARDKASYIDTALWDRTFRLEKIVKQLDNKGIQHDIDAPASNSFMLGASPLIQATNAEKLDQLDKKLRVILDKHPELNEDEEFATNLQKFNTARQDMFSSSLTYNKHAHAYNSFISDFPSSIIAKLYKKRDKQLFSYVFVDLNELSKTDEFEEYMNYGKNGK